MTALDEMPALAAFLPNTLPAAMNTLLDEPLHGDLVPLNPQHVMPGDYVLLGGESGGDWWLRVDEARDGRVSTVSGAPLEGDLVWRRRMADVVFDVALAETSGGAA